MDASWGHNVKRLRPKEARAKALLGVAGLERRLIRIDYGFEDCDGATQTLMQASGLI